MEMTNVWGAITAVVIYLSSCLVFGFRMMRWQRWARWVGVAQFLVAIPLVILLATAASFGLPVWPIFIILGIDELMDMARTAVNVIGNCLSTAVIARWEGEFDDEAARNFKTEMLKE